MTVRRTIATLAVLGLGAAGAGATAWFAADYIERSSSVAVVQRMETAGLPWVDVQTDGLQLILAGRAPDERARFRALTEAGDVVAPARLVDAMDVAAADSGAAPRFLLEILRNETEISLIGLTPDRAERGPVARLVARDALVVTDLAQQVDRPAPPGWMEAVRFAIEALDDLPRAKVSVEPGRVSITAVADSAEARTRLETALRRARPASVTLTLDIAAPRPVIAPFTLRFVRPLNAPARFEACAVDTPAARTRILAAAAEAGWTGTTDCVVGLGAPSAAWGEAAATAIAALADLGAGSVTLSDADVTLVARPGTAEAVFDRVAAELDTALPAPFSLTATLPDPPGEAPEGPEGTPEFLAIRSPEGQVQLRGRLFDDAQERAVLAYGRALFGARETYLATREDATLPEGWPTRVLAGLDVLDMLQQGAVTVQPDRFEVRGVTGNSRAEAEISGLLSDRLGAGAGYEIEVEYLEELDPLLNIPTPRECEEELNAILVDKKLTFAPGEAVIEASGDVQLGVLTEKLRDCGRGQFEIGGHTDSQGRETMNQDLSRARAEALRDALIDRGVPPSQLTARGYGETQPIADNDTEAGREANRRLTFTLLGVRSRTDRTTEPTLDPRDGAEATEEVPVDGPQPDGARPDPAEPDETQPEEGGE